MINQPRSIRRGMKWAQKAALLSTAPHHKVGSSIMKGKRVLSVGWNSDKTHPASKTRYNAHHAEFACIVGNHKLDLIGCTLYVTRVTPGGRISMAKPCSDCCDIIRAAGIDKVFYTTHSGDVERLIWNDATIITMPAY